MTSSKEKVTKLTSEVSKLLKPDEHQKLSVLASIGHQLGLHESGKPFSLERLALELASTDFELSLWSQTLENEKKHSAILQRQLTKAELQSTSLHYEKQELSEQADDENALVQLQSSTETLVAKDMEYREHIKARVCEEDLKNLGIRDSDLYDLQRQLADIESKRQQVAEQRSHFGTLSPKESDALNQIKELEATVSELQNLFDERIAQMPM